MGQPKRIKRKRSRPTPRSPARPYRESRQYLESPELGKPERTEPLQRGGPVAGVGEHDRIGGLALRDQLRLLLRAAMTGTRKINSTQGIHPYRQDLTKPRCAGGGRGGVPGRRVDDGDGYAVGEVVGGEACGGHDAGHVLGELLGGEGDDEAGLAGARVADHDDPHARLARQIRGRRRGRRTRHAARLLSLPVRLRVLRDLGGRWCGCVRGAGVVCQRVGSEDSEGWAGPWTRPLLRLGVEERPHEIFWI